MSLQDFPRTTIALGVGHRFSATTKALAIQTTSDVTAPGGTGSTVVFGDAFQDWYAYAPPPVPVVDAHGTISGATEFITSEIGDELVCCGSRDVRVAKYAQDVKAGEFALVNELGYRLFVGKKAVSIVAGGGFLTFDIESKKVGLTGIPQTPGGDVPYLSIDSSSIGITSASGAASFSVSGSQATVTAPSISLDGSRVNVGIGAADPVVTYSQLMSVVAQLVAIFTAHGHPAIGAPPSVPMVLVLVPGTRVFAPAF